MPGISKKSGMPKYIEGQSRTAGPSRIAGTWPRVLTGAAGEGEVLTQAACEDARATFSLHVHGLEHACSGGLPGRNKEDAVFRGNFTDAPHVGTTRSLAGRGHALEEDLEARRSRVQDEPQRSVAAVAEGMRGSAGEENGRARRDLCPHAVTP
jgi:hypothetical protein